jgi:hypothetical protein
MEPECSLPCTQKPRLLRPCVTFRNTVFLQSGLLAPHAQPITERPYFFSVFKTGHSSLGLYLSKWKLPVIQQEGKESIRPVTLNGHLIRLYPFVWSVYVSPTHPSVSSYTVLPSWPNVRYYSCICKEKLKKTKKHVRIACLGEDIWTQDFQTTKQDYCSVGHDVRYFSLSVSI